MSQKPSYNLRRKSYLLLPKIVKAPGGVKVDLCEIRKVETKSVIWVQGYAGAWTARKRKEVN